jgi:hypothetical protein
VSQLPTGHLLSFSSPVLLFSGSLLLLKTI